MDNCGHFTWTFPLSRDQAWTFYWPPPPSRGQLWTFYKNLPFVTWPSVDFLLTPSPLLLVHVAIECPQSEDLEKHNKFSGKDWTLVVANMMTTYWMKMQLAQSRWIGRLEKHLYSIRVWLFKICLIVESKSMLIYFCCQIAALHIFPHFIAFFPNYLKILSKFESEKDQKCYFVVKTPSMMTIDAIN